MAKVIYKPEPGTPDTHVQFGITFGPEPVEVTNEAVLAKLRGSPFYEVDGAADDSDEGPKAVHKGRGVYAIVKGGEVLKSDLDKADAEAFNALSDDDKAAYLA